MLWELHPLQQFTFMMKKFRYHKTHSRYIENYEMILGACKQKHVTSTDLYFNLHNNLVITPIL